MQQIANSTRKCTAATLLLAAWAAAVSAQTYQVPATHVPVLETQRQAISACRNKASQLQARLCTLKQESGADLEAAKQALEVAKSEYQNRMNPYQAKLCELTQLIQQRQQVLQAELARLPLFPQDHPAEYNRKVFLRNELRDSCGRDLSEAAGVIGRLKTDIQVQQAAYLSEVQVIQKAYCESAQARKHAYDAGTMELRSEQDKANSLISSYNTALLTYGMPLAEVAWK